MPSFSDRAPTRLQRTFAASPDSPLSSPSYSWRISGRRTSIAIHRRTPERLQKKSPQAAPIGSAFHPAEMRASRAALRIFLRSALGASSVTSTARLNSLRATSQVMAFYGWSGSGRLLRGMVREATAEAVILSKPSLRTLYGTPPLTFVTV